MLNKVGQGLGEHALPSTDFVIGQALGLGKKDLRFVGRDKGKDGCKTGNTGIEQLRQ